MEDFFMALADRTRLRLLNLMRDGEVCVLDFTDVLHVPQSKISRHLAFLRRARLVDTRRDGKWIYYQLQLPVDAHNLRVFREIQNWLARDAEMRRDVEKLREINSAPSVERAADYSVSESVSPAREELPAFLL